MIGRMRLAGWADRVATVVRLVGAGGRAFAWFLSGLCGAHPLFESLR